MVDVVEHGGGLHSWPYPLPASPQEFLEDLTDRDFDPIAEDLASEAHRRELLPGRREEHRGKETIIACLRHWCEGGLRLNRGAAITTKGQSN